MLFSYTRSLSRLQVWVFHEKAMRISGTYISKGGDEQVYDLNINNGRKGKQDGQRGQWKVWCTHWMTFGDKHFRLLKWIFDRQIGHWTCIPQTEQSKREGDDWSRCFQSEQQAKNFSSREIFCPGKIFPLWIKTISLRLRNYYFEMLRIWGWGQTELFRNCLDLQSFLLEAGLLCKCKKTLKSR